MCHVERSNVLFVAQSKHPPEGFRSTNELYDLIVSHFAVLFKTIEDFYNFVVAVFIRFSMCATKKHSRILLTQSSLCRQKAYTYVFFAYTFTVQRLCNEL